MKTALVLGAGGFIGSHLVKKLKSEGFWVRGVDLKYPEELQDLHNDYPLAPERVSVGNDMLSNYAKNLKTQKPKLNPNPKKPKKPKTQTQKPYKSGFQKILNS